MTRRTKTGRTRNGLVLFGAGKPDAPMRWVEIDLRDGVMIAHGSAQNAEDLPVAPVDQVALVLSGTEAQMRRVALPARTDAQARAGAAYAFEGQLGDMQDAHFALGANQDDAGHRLVAALSGARLDAWMAACLRLGVAPKGVFLDFSLVPVEPKSVEILALDDQALVGAGRLGGFSMEAPLAGAVLPRWLGDLGGEVKTISLSDALHGVVAMNSFPGGPEVLPRPAGDARALLAVAALKPPRHAPNLLQDRFASKQSVRKPPNLLALAIMLAVIAVLTQASASLLAGWRDQQSASAILQKAEQDFRAAHPNVRRIVDLNAQARGMVNAKAAGRNHPFLVASEPLIAAQLGHPGIRLESLRNAAPERTVQAAFSATTTQDLDAFVASMQAKGVKIAPGALRPEQGRFVIEIALEATP